jgi:FkbH-like protein
MYQADQVRQSIAAEFGDNYLSFLRSCEIQMEIDSLTSDNLERVHELTQRTNQMNFSGTRYDRSTLFKILKSEHFDSFVLACHDRFGSYGIVGFSIVDKREPRMTDLMFSCRVQSKRVEHAFLTYVLKKYRDETASDMWVNYRKTPRNAASGRVFENMQFECAGEENGVTSLVFRKHRDIPDDKLVKIRVPERAGLRGALAGD